MVILSIIFTSVCEGRNIISYNNFLIPSFFESESKILDIEYIWSKKLGSSNKQNHMNIIPLIEKELIYTVDSNGVISALQLSNGKLLWSTDTKVSLSSQIAIHNNIIVAGSSCAKLIALSHDGGRVIWQAILPDILFSTPKILDNVVYIQTCDDSVSAYKLDDGNQLWIERLPIAKKVALINNSSPTIYKSILIISDSSGNLRGLRRDNGKRKWEKTISLQKPGLSTTKQIINITKNPIVYSNILYIVTPQGYLSSIDLKTGKANWQKKTSIYHSISLRSKKIFTIDAKGSLRALNLINGNILWKTNKTIDGVLLSDPLYIAGKVLAGDHRGYLHIFDANSGEYISHFKVANGGINFALVAFNKFIVIQTSSNVVLALKFKGDKVFSCQYKQRICV